MEGSHEAPEPVDAAERDADAATSAQSESEVGDVEALELDGWPLGGESEGVNYI
jgi:hypothetical protein